MSSLQIALVISLVLFSVGVLVWPFVKGWIKFKNWDSFKKLKQQLGSGRIRQC